MIDEITSFEPSLTPSINKLLRQLTELSRPFSDDDLRRIVADPASHLFVVRAESEVVAMLTLCCYSSPTGRKVWIEDVVVDTSFRGQGFGRELVEYAKRYCQMQLAPCTLMLTSNPTRVVANELYRSNGFEQKITNVYRLNCPDNE